MKHKYISLLVMQGCLPGRQYKKDIHEELKETIRERERILKELELYSKRARYIEQFTGLK